MKPAPLILAATLLCNVALVGIVVFKQPATPAKTTRARASASAPSPALASANASTPDPRTLAQLFASDDTRALIQRLREMNLPPDMIRSIARMRLDKEFAARFAALEDPPRLYWLDDFSRRQPKLDPKRRAEKLALQDEYQAALKELIGDTPIDRSIYGAYLRRQYGDLSDAQIEKINIVAKDYTDLRSQLREEMKGITFPDDQAQLALLDKEQHADLAKILTPDELRDYELHSSPVAEKVQKQIKYFNSTEAEYIALYDAQAAVDEQTAGANLPDTELKRLREAAAQSVLTPERFEEYKIATTETYPDVRDLAASLKHLSNSQAATAQIITIQNTISAQADSIRNDTTIEPAGRNAQLAALARDAEQQLKTVFSGSGFPRYQRGSTGAWLRQLTPAQPKQSKQGKQPKR
jgi:hypothetical protein